MESLFEQIDGYCERTDFTFWAEPINAVTNAAFILAALWMWRRTEGVLWGRVLCVILFAIGVGSFLFHTYATVWAAMADTIPIGIFILVYLFLVHWHVLSMKVWQALVAVLLFFPYAWAVVSVANQLPFFAISNFYWTVPILLFLYGPALWRRYPETARGFVIGGAILSLSITLRSIDEPLCETIPIGTHYWWHILNGIMLGWMIEVYRRHRVAGGGARV